MSHCPTPTELLPRFPGVKDPDDRVNLTFKANPLPVGVTVTSVTITEVDVSDTPVLASDFTLGTVVLTPPVGDDGIWTAICSADGGLANPVVTAGVIPEPRLYLMRSRWFLSNGTHRDRTLRLYVGNN